MPPKKTKVDKAKIAKAIEDKTFGLKNKSKSNKVQKYVSQVTVAVRQSQGAVSSEQAKAKKKANKEAQAQADLELKALFNEALLAGKKAPGAAAGKGNDPEPVATETREKIVQETFEVVEGERTIEDMIEEQRAKLMAEGKMGTPVNAETLAAWKARRLAMKLEEERKLVEREIAKKGKKKGLAILTGRALFDYDATLFRDDEDAAGEEETNQREEIVYEEDGQEGTGAAVGLVADSVSLLFLGEDNNDDDLDDLDDEESEGEEQEDSEQEFDNGADECKMGDDRKPAAT